MLRMFLLRTTRLPQFTHVGLYRYFSSPAKLPDLELFKRLQHYAQEQHDKNTDGKESKTAIVELHTGRQYTYATLLKDVLAVKQRIAPKDLEQQRVAVLCQPGYHYVVAQWSIWAAGGVFVPLCVSHPAKELEYHFQNAECSFALVDKSMHSRLATALGSDRTKPLIDIEQAIQEGAGSTSTEFGELIPFDKSRNAMFVYTSGTTGRPKGVVSTHASLSVQIEAIVQAWEICSTDRLVHSLPLHHVHGIVNALTCLLWSGATVEFAPKFDARSIWSRLSNQDLPPVTLFMGVPTMYAKLLEALDDDIDAAKACKHMRVMISGSSALPVSIREKWRRATGITLLERYGMTETGMILGTSLKNPEKRILGCVGWPFPNVQVRIQTDDGKDGWGQENMPGEIQVRGPALFKEYWKREDATRDAFTEDGWFKTGDTAEWTSDGGGRILGRTSVDIIKSGGYKISALEIERVLMEHANIADCAVVGVADEVWGQRVAAAVVWRDPSTPSSLEELRAFASKELAAYKLPTLFRSLSELPRNVMGKVNKKQIVTLFAEAD